MRFCVITLMLGLSNFAFSIECKTEEQIRKLDQAYESAVHKSNINFLKRLLDENFIWVHNNLKVKEEKHTLLNRVSSPKYDQPLSRKVDIERSINFNDTWVLMGISEVKKLRPSEENANKVRVNRYYFSRTYARTGKSCRLISSITRKVSVEDH